MVLQLSEAGNHILWLQWSFLPPSILPGVGGPLVMSLVVVSQKAFPLEEGAVPEAGRKEEGGVYRLEDVFQLLLFTPVQSKLSGLFQVTSGQSAVGLAVSSSSRGGTASPWVRARRRLFTEWVTAVGQFWLERHEWLRPISGSFSQFCAV